MSGRSSTIQVIEPMRRRLRVMQLAATDGTIGKLMFALMEELRDAGWRVAAACDFAPGSRHAGRVIDAGFELFRVPTSRRLSPAAIGRSLAAVAGLVRRWRPDVLHVHTPVMAVVGRIAGRLCGVPAVVYTAHGYYHHDGMAAAKRWLFAGVEKIACRYLTDLLLLQSGEDHEWARTERVHSIRTGLGPVHIGNGVELERFDPTGYPPVGRPVVLTICRIVREKGVFDLAEASKTVLNAMPSVLFRVVGDGPDINALKARVTELGVAGNWEFLGFRADIPELLAGARVYALPSWREGMPRSVIEAMAAARPVVATDIRGCREEVAVGETGLLVPMRDPGRLAAALTRILSDPALGRWMGLAGRRRALALYDERRVTRSERQLFDLLAAHLELGGARTRSFRPVKRRQRAGLVGAAERL